jgi:mono/diheme cytochrome c family protein
VPEGTPLRRELLERAAGPVGSNEQGNTNGLYRKHCVVCHGISGDGAGPNAAVLYPYPRDFRKGVFKYTSTPSGEEPVRADLERTVRRGLPGTAMPSFDGLTDQEVDALVEYVQYLSLRGETELELLQVVVDLGDYPVDLSTVTEDIVVPLAGRWAAAVPLVIAPPPPPPTDTREQIEASIARGRELYLSQRARCAECHGPADRHLLANFRGHQGHAHARGRPLARKQRRADVGGNLAPGPLRALAGGDEGSGKWGVGGRMKDEG